MSEKRKAVEQGAQDLTENVLKNDEDDKRLSRLKKVQASFVRSRVREALGSDSEIEVVTQEAKEVAHELHMLRLNITKKTQRWINILTEMRDLAIKLTELHEKEKSALEEQWENRLKRSLKEAGAEARVRRDLGLPLE